MPAPFYKKPHDPHPPCAVCQGVMTPYSDEIPYRFKRRQTCSHACMKELVSIMNRRKCKEMSVKQAVKGAPRPFKTGSKAHRDHEQEQRNRAATDVFKRQAERSILHPVSMAANYQSIGWMWGY